RKKWETLCEQPNTGVRVIAQEFDAKVAEHRNYITKVDGQNISFTKASINNCFKLPNIDNDKLAAFEKAPDYNDVVKILCASGID
ncbi:hypothetical protein PanWU01x14_152840, partial [Parasponia andersonii]